MFRSIRTACDNAHELVGKINGRFGNLLVVPVHYLDCSLSFEHMVSLYRIADVTLITSIRDGMNLVAYEYIACQQDRGGVLVLSEFAGAAQSLGAGAIQINPWSFQELAEAIHQARLVEPRARGARRETKANMEVAYPRRSTRISWCPRSPEASEDSWCWDWPAHSAPTSGSDDTRATIRPRLPPSFRPLPPRTFRRRAPPPSVLPALRSTDLHRGELGLVSRCGAEAVGR
jgi:hypothetical protein